MSNCCSLCSVKCPVVKDDETFLHNGKKVTAKNLRFYQCPICHEQFVDSALDKENSRIIQDAKKRSNYDTFY